MSVDDGPAPGEKLDQPATPSLAATRVMQHADPRTLHLDDAPLRKELCERRLVVVPEHSEYGGILLELP
jgi:hypothetical protein